jgi:hypothetical protein
MNLQILEWLCITSVLLSLQAERAEAQALEQANREFLAHRIDRAFELYETVVRGDADSADRANAASMAALIQWRYHRRHDEAAQLLEAAIAQGCDKLPPLLALSRLERDRGDFGKAWSAASRARLEAHGPAETRKARIECARVAVEECAQAGQVGSGSCNSHHLEQARTDLLGLLENGQNPLTVPQLLLRAAVLLGDGETALRAWHAYFWVDPQEKAYGVLAQLQQELSKLWPAWKGAADSQEVNCRLIKSLADSRLYKEAVILADRYGVGENAPDDIKDILVYGRGLGDLEKFIGEQYRLHCNGQADGKTIVAGIAERLCAIWNKSSWSTQPCPVPIPFDMADPDAVAKGMSALQEFAKRFGMIIRIENDGADVSLGHAIIQETREIEQYGKHAQFTYYLLDSLVANGWAAWATDGNSQYGGWTTEEGGYAQVREPFVDAGIAAWTVVADPEARKKAERAIQRYSEQDWTTAEQNPYAYLPGLAKRLQLAACDEALEQLKKEGLSGDKLRKEFISTVEKAILDSAVYAHEGRHIIDLQLGISYNVDLEYRAKLAEVAFAPIPRLAFGSIFTGEIGRETGHGLANLRIVKGIVTWMQANSHKIKGLDTARPLLPQFDLLTDEQMRELARSMDPLATGEG